MKKIAIAYLFLFIAGLFAASAQTIGGQSIAALLNDQVIKIGQPATINGETFTVTTNEAGNFIVTVSGATGSITVTPPTTPAQAFQQAGAMINENNPTNATFYGTNEIVARVGAVYLQNSGQAVIEIGVEKYGLLKSMPQIGVGGALFQGNKNGQSGTAGACAFADYRKIIGDVSAQFGAGGGYDNWNSTFMGVVKADVELRQNAHLGEYVGVGYAIEPGNSNSGKGGLMVRGGVNYAF